MENTSASKISVFLKTDIAIAAQKYLFVGGACALLDWSLFAFLLYLAELHYLVAGTLAFLVATGLNYLLSVRFVFGTGRRQRTERIVLLYMVSFVGIGINLSVLTVGIDVFEAHEMLSKVFATGIAVFWNFLARYYFVFRD